jgi:hypothetical protein
VATPSTARPSSPQVSERGPSPTSASRFGGSTIAGAPGWASAVSATRSTTVDPSGRTASEPFGLLADNGVDIPTSLRRPGYTATDGYADPRLRPVEVIPFSTQQRRGEVRHPSGVTYIGCLPLNPRSASHASEKGYLPEVARVLKRDDGYWL